MSLRRKGRELALQILYQWDIHRDTSGWLEDFWAQNPTHAEAKTFAECLVNGVITHADELDRLLGRYAEHWTVHRMAITDRTVLRMAVYELLYRSEEHTSELQSLAYLVCRLLLEKKKIKHILSY